MIAQEKLGPVLDEIFPQEILLDHGLIDSQIILDIISNQLRQTNWLTYPSKEEQDGNH